MGAIAATGTRLCDSCPGEIKLTLCSNHRAAAYASQNCNDMVTRLSSLTPRIAAFGALANSAVYHNQQIRGKT